MTLRTESTPTRSTTRAGDLPGKKEEELQFAFVPPATTMTLNDPHSVSVTGSSSPDSSDVDLPRCSESEDSLDDNLNDCSPCARGDQCRQLQRVVTMDDDDQEPVTPRVLSFNIPICSPENSPPAKTGPQQSCVDCGGCLTCCDCGSGGGVDDAESQQRRRSSVRSINLGAIEGIEVLDRQLSSSTALTLPPSSESMRISYSLEKSSSLVVRTIIDEEEEETASVAQLFAEGEGTIPVGVH
jgi:hypothetical protein